MATENELLQKLSDAVVDMDEAATAEFSRTVVEGGLDAYRAIEKGLADGMERAGRLFEEHEYFVPELILCADAMYAGLEILKPHIKPTSGGQRFTVVIGVIEGDTHDIGKNLVKIMLSTAGFDVIDLGRDIPATDFVDAAVAHKAHVIAISTLMTTTMSGMGEVVDILKERGLRDKVKVVVGGGPISSAFAGKIGADGYAANASEAIRFLRTLLGSEVAA
ncbi:MAG: corrinoid protein [Acidobacteriota bacterium]|jgi:corrinoid protein of di/trimethylamine methyltransferase|nr:corrinoid protein [Acidobacteriota bacterium]